MAVSAWPQLAAAAAAGASIQPTSAQKGMCAHHRWSRNPVPALAAAADAPKQHQQPHQQQQQQRQQDSSTTTPVSAQLVSQFVCLVVHRTWPHRPGMSTPGRPHPSFLSFVSRIQRTSGVSSIVLFLSLLYIVRFRRASSPTISSNSGVPDSISALDGNSFGNQAALSEARLVTAAVILAQKFTDDNRFTNKTWAELTGFALADINKMETDFLAKIDFKLHVGEEEFRSWVRYCKAWASQLGVSLEEDPNSTSPSKASPQTTSTIPSTIPANLPPLPTARSSQQQQQHATMVGYYRKRKVEQPDPLAFHPDFVPRKIPRTPSADIPHMHQHAHHQTRRAAWSASNTGINNSGGLPNNFAYPMPTMLIPGSQQTPQAQQYIQMPAYNINSNHPLALHPVYPMPLQCYLPPY
ncbi:uncharacterized protein EV422DRAFT_535334 [Fimicolochytrium jonesii]|uniref:uncharacterized protein n=1 Tax=Fimicolochytrium jonesii TaxID=1396493 RepID=UPI0022FE9AAB|nr:uncharacterized protein EV422DRAFT_535334 [Fimicolochytrium jonesii]KAI8819162.1 hypothetical protein EV422DRAFT_535334 [Fimicolochytrium jonesii]